ncbi:MAG: hypothetical protein IT294_06750 [Deltaproteobacteria bacterium]|nr:hypothetical protein [Deltaproteobacteria bacterium]
MSILPAIMTSGLALIERADRRLGASARAFARAADAEVAGAAPSDGAPASADGGDLVGAAVGVVYGRTSGASGVRLLAIGRDIEKTLLDVLA